MVHLEPKNINLSLVPLDEKSKTKLQEIKNNIQNIYNKVGVHFDIETKPVFDISSIVSGNTIETLDDDFGTTYSKQQQEINNLYKESNKSRYVLFITDKKSSTGQKGYFRLNGQFGYIFGNPDEKTPAHEVGHGVFKLEHPSSTIGTTQGKTKLLLDYGNGTALSHLDWKQINDPKLKIYAFQKQEEGEIAEKIWFTPDWKPFTVKGSSTILSLKNYPKGTVPGFVHNSISYIYNIEKKNYFDEKGNPIP